MSVTAYASGTLTCTGGGVEDFVTSPNVAGTFTFHVDLNTIVAGDVIDAKIYSIILTGGTTRLTYQQRFEGSSIASGSEKNHISVPISNELTDTNSLRFSLTQSGPNSDKAIPWKVLRYA